MARSFQEISDAIIAGDRSPELVQELQERAVNAPPLTDDAFEDIINGALMRGPVGDVRDIPFVAAD